MIHPANPLLMPSMDTAALPATISSAPADDAEPPTSVFARLLANGSAASHEQADAKVAQGNAIESNVAAPETLMTLSPPVDLGSAPEPDMGDVEVPLTPDNGKLLPDSEVTVPVAAGKDLPPNLVAAPGQPPTVDPHSATRDAATDMAATRTPLPQSQAAETEASPLSAATAPAPIRSDDPSGPAAQAHAVPPGAELRTSSAAAGFANSNQPVAPTVRPTSQTGLMNPPNGASDSHPALPVSQPTSPAAGPDPTGLRSELRIMPGEATDTAAPISAKLAASTTVDKAASDPLVSATLVSASNVAASYLRDTLAPRAGAQPSVEGIQLGSDGLMQPETPTASRQSGDRILHAMVAAGSAGPSNPTGFDQLLNQPAAQQGNTQAFAMTTVDSELSAPRALERPAPAAPQSVAQPVAQAPTTLQLTLGNRQELGERLGALLGSVRSLTGSQLSIALAPQELGRLEIKMTTGPDQSLNLSITTQHAGTRDLVEAQLNRLKTALDGEGFERVQVDLRDERGGQSGARHAHDREGSEPRLPGDHGPDEGLGSEAAFAIGIADAQRSNAGPAGALRSGIDAYA